MNIFKPLMKNWPIKLSVTLVLVAIVCVTLFLTGTWGTRPDDVNDPDHGGIVVSPAPTPGDTPAGEDEPAPDAGTEPEPEPQPDPDPEPVFTGPFNPLTGIPMDEELTRNRPIAMPVGNTVDAQPLNGLSDADILYEVPAEGAATRMFAIFQDISAAGLIGGIRSARHYTVQIAYSYDAILVSYGGSPQAYDEISKLRISHVDEGRSMLIRSPDRNGRRLSREHTGSTKGSLAAEELPKYNFRMVHDEGYDLGLVFAEDGTPSNGESAVDIHVQFSGKSSTLIYNDEGKVYHLRQFGNDFIDANDNSFPAFTNILVLKMAVSGIPGDGAGRRDVVTTGNGSGYYANGGKYIEINWSRADMASPFVYTHLDGSVLELGIGRSYIAITPALMNPTFE